MNDAAPFRNLLPPPLEVQGLNLAYGRQTVLQDLAWRLEPGQVVGLLGRNGAGKTSLLEALLGLRDLRSGSVRLFGQPVQALDDAVRARIGYVPQQSDLFDWLTGAEMLAYLRSFYPRWNQPKVDALLARWDIDAHKPIARLSGGQQQRLSIVRALAHEPDLLVLDEPVAGLDPAARRAFLKELVEQVLERGTTVVFSTHILSDLERVAFNVAFLQRGRIVLQAPLDDLLDSVRRVSGPQPALQRWLASSGAELLQPSAAGGPALVRGGVLTSELHGQRVTLEDLFEALT